MFAFLCEGVFKCFHIEKIDEDEESQIETGHCIGKKLFSHASKGKFWKDLIRWWTWEWRIKKVGGIFCWCQNLVFHHLISSCNFSKSLPSSTSKTVLKGSIFFQGILICYLKLKAGISIPQAKLQNVIVAKVFFTAEGKLKVIEFHKKWLPRQECEYEFNLFASFHCFQQRYLTFPLLWI